MGLPLTAGASIAAGATGLLVAVLLVLPPALANAACNGRSAEPESISAGEAEEAVLCLLNKQRAKRELPRLTRNKQLDAPAHRHSRYMVERRCFAHKCRGEPDLAERLRDYLRKGGQVWGENIAWGGGEFGSPQSVVHSWMRSDGHRRNIVSRDYEHIGIGIVWGRPEGGGGGVPAGTYTTDFGARSGLRP